jgi:hypothetical protein
MLKILIHPSPKTEAHYTQHSIFSPFLHWIEENKIAILEAVGGGLQMFFDLEKRRNNVWGFNLLWVLKCSLTGLSTLEPVFSAALKPT